MTRMPVLKGKPRPYRAGRQVGAAMVETAHILYLLDNRQQYLEGIKDAIDHALDLVKHERRKKRNVEGER
jgi:hypothetical protein